MSEASEDQTDSALTNEYVFPCYWGGATKSANPPQIHKAIRDLRAEVGSLAAKKQAGGPMFPVRGAKELAQKLAQALNDLNLVAFPQAQEVHERDTANIPGNTTASGKPVFRTLVHVKTTVRLGAPDGSFVDFVGSGHGGDVDDKAGGKGDTYAWKAAILKGLCIPDQDMVDTDDEAPSEEKGRGASKLKSVPAATKLETPPKDGASDPVPEDASGLAYVIAQIGRAEKLSDLEAIAAGIKSGTLALAGADRLRASQAYVARKKALTDAAQPA